MKDFGWAYRKAAPPAECTLCDRPNKDIRGVVVCLHCDEPAKWPAVRRRDLA